MNSIEPMLNYSSPAYTGPALKMGAGVPSIDAFRAAHRLDYRVVGAHCPTVGFAGGSAQGGGHGELTPVHGLATDNIVEWEVVTTANGTRTRATPRHNANLYWALSGDGGGGTYAVVVAMTVRSHCDDDGDHAPVRRRQSRLQIAPRRRPRSPPSGPPSTGRQRARRPIADADALLGRRCQQRGAAAVVAVTGGTASVAKRGDEARPQRQSLYITAPGQVGAAARCARTVQPVVAAARAAAKVALHA
jgi:hypothetical protein